MDITKLDAAQKHILTLIDKDKKEDGWTLVSEVLYPVISKNMPDELTEFEKLESGGRARLTEKGRDILDAMAWL